MVKFVVTYFLLIAGWFFNLLSAQNKSILLDGYFNHETKKDSVGNIVQTHYLWNETTDGGFSGLGKIFNNHGITTEFSAAEITAEKLKAVDIYLIVDPDIPKENPSPNYILEKHINIIYNWVNTGGILLLFANDSGNVEFTHYNHLAEKFGIHFNENRSSNLVKGNDLKMGTISILPGNEIFISAKNIYIKDICTLGLKPPAKPVLKDADDIIIAIAEIGKGTVFAIGDPWLYNEYLESENLRAGLENHTAATDLVKWLIKKTNKQ